MRGRTGSKSARRCFPMRNKCSFACLLSCVHASKCPSCNWEARKKMQADNDIELLLLLPQLNSDFLFKIILSLFELNSRIANAMCLLFLFLSHTNNPTNLATQSVRQLDRTGQRRLIWSFLLYNINDDETLTTLLI